MQIFYLINGFAGHHPMMDALMRIVYVAAVPLLATVLAAWILLAPQTWMHSKTPSRSALLVAAFLSLFFGIATIGLIATYESLALGGKVLSHRPFLTHFVTSLVMEPNNNSFPCFEVMFAASMATLLWAGRLRLGIFGWIIAATLGIARLYCGSNFTVDVVVGAIWGIAIAGVALAICGVSLTFPLTSKTRLRWKPRFQGTAFALILIVAFIYANGRQIPKPHQSLFAHLQNSQTAQAAPLTDSKSTFTHATASDDSSHKHREMLLLSDLVKQDGHLPKAEKYLLGVLQNQRTGMPILGVNVAEIKSGKSAYRCAAIRFDVQGKGNAARKRVIAVAARLVKTAFHADARIDHIDILGIKQSAKDTSNPASGAPVFTASIDRQSLILAGERAWLNLPDTDPGLWLRARSLLYFDAQTLPSDEVFPVKEFLEK